MTKQELEKKYDLLIVRKDQTWLMPAFGWFMFFIWVVFFMWPFRKNLGTSFMEDFWTTYRLPFAKTRITYPRCAKDPMHPDNEEILEHELLHHIHQLQPWWGPLTAGILVSFFPAPILFSGRWWLERKPYLHNIVYHRYDIQSVVDSLWSGYLMPWPKRWMFKWFSDQSKQMIQDDVKNPFKN